MVVARGEDAQVVGRLDRGGVLGKTVANGGRVLGDGRFLDVVTGLSANKKTLMSEHSVDVGGGSFEDIEEGAEVEVGLLVVEVQFSTVRLFGGQVVGKHFSLQTASELIFEFDFGVQRVCGGPGLRKTQAYKLEGSAISMMSPLLAFFVEWVVFVSWVFPIWVGAPVWKTQDRIERCKHTGSFVLIFAFNLGESLSLFDPEMCRAYPDSGSAHRACDGSIMRRFPLDVEGDSIRGFRLDLEIGYRKSLADESIHRKSLHYLWWCGKSLCSAATRFLAIERDDKEDSSMLGTYVVGELADVTERDRNWSA